MMETNCVRRWVFASKRCLENFNKQFSYMDCRLSILNIQILRHAGVLQFLHQENMQKMKKNPTSAELCTIFLESRNSLMKTDYFQLKYRPPLYCSYIINTLIIPLRDLMRQWKANACQGINGQVSAKNGNRILLANIVTFQRHLDEFEQSYHCINTEQS